MRLLSCFGLLWFFCEEIHFITYSGRTYIHRFKQLLHISKLVTSIFSYNWLRLFLTKLEKRRRLSLLRLRLSYHIQVHTHVSLLCLFRLIIVKQILFLNESLLLLYLFLLGTDLSKVIGKIRTASESIPPLRLITRCLLLFLLTSSSKGCNIQRQFLIARTKLRMINLNIFNFRLILLKLLISFLLRIQMRKHLIIQS